MYGSKPFSLSTCSNDLSPSEMKTTVGVQDKTLLGVEKQLGHPI